MRILMALMLLSVSACVPGYRGFSDIPLGGSTYRIDVDRSGGRNAAQATREIGLVRAAEMTLQNGYTHFTVRDIDTDSSRSVTGTTPLNCQTTHINPPAGVLSLPGHSRTNCTGGDVITRRDHSTSLTITMQRGPGDGALDARQIIAEYGPRVGYQGRYAAQAEPVSMVPSAPAPAPSRTTSTPAVASTQAAQPLQMTAADAAHLAACRRLIQADLQAGLSTGGVTPASCETDPRLSPSAISACTRTVLATPVIVDVMAFGYERFECLENGKLELVNRYGQRIVTDEPYWMHPPRL